MIRLTVEQLYLLRDSIEASGQARTSVLPLQAMNTHRLIVAWAKTRTGEGLYLSIWKDAKAWAEAIVKDEAGEPLPYDFLNDQQSSEYSHAYPIPLNINSGTVDYNELERRVRRVVSAADAGHPEFGVSRENE